MVKTHCFNQQSAPNIKDICNITAWPIMNGSTHFWRRRALPKTPLQCPRYKPGTMYNFPSTMYNFLGTMYNVPGFQTKHFTTLFVKIKFTDNSKISWKEKKKLFYKNMLCKTELLEKKVKLKNHKEIHRDTWWKSSAVSSCKCTKLDASKCNKMNNINIKDAEDKWDSHSSITVISCW